MTNKRRLDAVLEIIGGYLILLAINAVWFSDQMGWPEVRLHPYFLVVTLIATRYGTLDGAVAGMVGATLHVWYQLDASPELYHGLGTVMDLNVMLAPYLMVVIGTLLGEVRQVADDEIRTLWTRVRSLRGDLEQLGSEARTVKQFNESLQARIASSTQTTGAFYDVAAKVQTLDESDALPSILEVTRKFVGAEKCAVYVRGPNAWDLRLSQGWDGSDQSPHAIPETNSVFQMLDQGKTVTLKDVGLDMDGTHVVMAAPLLHRDAAGESTIYGALTIQAIPFDSMNLATVRNLQGVAAWASQVLSSAEIYERVRERDPSDQTTGTFRYPYLLRRLEEEAGRWRRYSIPSSVLVMRISNYERVPKVKRAAFLRRVARLLMKNVRAVDIVARWKSADTFAMLLPATDAPGARVLAGRIAEQFNRDIMADVPRSAGLSLRFGLGTTGEHGDRRDELVRHADLLELS